MFDNLLSTFVEVKIINRTVLILSIVSLFADMASEMLYPVIPVYLNEIGFSILLIGILEGVAEFTAGLTKGYFGKRSDEKGLRLPFIKWGYFLSALSKPMMAVFTLPLWIFFARTTDRLGKGFRTAARDALLSQNTTPNTKAKVFGFHRALDTTGAVLGPLIALLFLSYFPQQYRILFFVAFIPGLISVALIYLLKEKKQPVSTLQKGNFFSFFKYWNISSTEYKRLITGLLVFALINSSDIFLLLKTKDITGSDTITISAYIFYNVVFAIFSYPFGRLADKIGYKKVLVTGFLLFSCVYFSFAITSSTIIIFIAFLIYGIYAAATEGVAKAWITKTADDTNTATALGLYASCQSVCALLASSIAGLIWYLQGSNFTFTVTAIGGLLVMFYFLVFLPRFKTVF